MLDFKLETFLNLLAGYNQNIWPLQILSYFLGILSTTIAIKTFKNSSRMISAILSFFWLWTGIVFCIFYWGPVYKPAYLFCVLWIVQGVFFLVSGVFKSDISFQFKPDPRSFLGLLFIIYALAGYQIFGYFIGHRYPRFFAPGLVPCPTNVFTVGILLLTDKKFPRYLMVLPFLWSISGFMPVSKGVLEDMGMIIIGIAGMLLIMKRDKFHPPEEQK